MIHKSARHLFAAATMAISFAIPANAGDAIIIDGDTIRISDTTYRLHGIDTPEPGQKCKGARKDWACGNAATKRLVELTEGKQVTCDNRGTDEYSRVLAVCFVDGADLNAVMVREGLAWAFVRYSDDYAGEESAARSAGVGVWQAKTETPWDFRARRWEVAVQEAPEGCPIKGNISKHGNIYHAPWSPWYKRTKISLNKGERWFCDEQQALDAGWRAPIWGR